MRKYLFPLVLVTSLFITKPAKAVSLEGISTWDIAKNLAGRTVGTPVGAAGVATVVAGGLGIGIGRQTRQGIKIGSRVIGGGINLVSSYKPKTKLVQLIFKFVARNIDVAEEALYRKLSDHSPRLLNKYKTLLGGEEEAVLTLWEVAKQIDKLDKISNIPEDEIPPKNMFELLRRLEVLQEQHDTLIEDLKGLYSEYTEKELELLTSPE